MALHHILPILPMAPVTADRVCSLILLYIFVFENFQRLTRCLAYGHPPPPPSESVAFGHGAPQGYNFRYSQCTGKRKALLVGINYFGQKGQLRGCINDVKNMSSYLNQAFGYAREDMVLLTDDQQNPMSQPTKANILRAMHWLVKDAQPNDSLFFHYSGMSHTLAGFRRKKVF